MSREEHRRRAPASVGAAILTVSDTRTLKTDASGRGIRALLEASGHRVVQRALVRDDPEAIRRRLRDLLEAEGVEAILITGGTGIAPRDGTCEVVESFLEKRIEGFGELFRALSYPEVGAAAMLSRAVAGVCRGRILVAMPGAEPAVRLAMTRLVLPELAHMVGLVRSGPAD